MKRNRIKTVCLRLVIFSFVAGSAIAATEREYIWPDGKMPDAQSHQIGATTAEMRAKGFQPDNFRRPYLDWFDPPAAEGRTDACMILISGGGYSSCCDVGLVEQWRRKLTAVGIRCVSLTYRTPRPQGLPFYRSAWEDGQRAVRVVRSQAQKRGFNPEKIGTISMSAGSHLATLLATSSQTPAYTAVDELDALPCHINLAVTCAIAYGMTDGLGTPNARDGDAIDVKLDPLFQFDVKTCPMCMFHGGLDVYSPNASTEVYRQLRRMKIPTELHLFADRHHGFFGADGRGDAATGYDNWFGRAEEFLRQRGFLGAKGPEVEFSSRFSDTFTRAREKQDLWPEGAMPDVQPNQSVKPFLEWFLPKEQKTRAIQIVFPGGAYQHCSYEKEGVDIARYFNSKGITAVVVVYRTPRPLAPLAKHTSAWQDAQRAIRLVRKAAASRGLDPERIGAMGFSAGGHLTLMAATSSQKRAYWPKDEIDKVPCHLNWACPVYPAYALTDGAESPNAKGGNENDSVPVREFSFDLKTPPMCFLHGDADGWAAMNSVKIWERLRRMGIQSDLHTFANRGHCFHFKAAPGTASFTCFDRIVEFLNHKRFLTK
ncbi:MAG: alpha/beta hydrolase [Kiritimatiellae bacterium]|nr:alpha/beta hydrolase [Kiritimatiellia bacterium]